MEPGPAICHVLVPCVLQKFKEYVNGSNLITKLQAKHDLLKQTLGEGESGSGGLRGGAVFPSGFCCGLVSCFSLRHWVLSRMRPGTGATFKDWAGCCSLWSTALEQMLSEVWSGCRK